MKKITKSDYNNALQYILKSINGFPNYLKPTCIVQNGHITKLGASDIDLLIGFNDEFVFANEFITRFISSLQKLESKEIFFPHLPFLYPMSLLKKIPKITFNPIEEIKVISGTSPFINSENLSKEQNILNSLDQLHNRIVMMVELVFLNITNIRQVILVGHSLIHSLNLANKIGAEFKKEEFKEFLFIESLREDMEKTGNIKNISEERYREICKNLCAEFFKILCSVYSYLDSKICVHFSYTGDSHQYNDSVTFKNLYTNKINRLEMSLKDNKIYINGFSWHLKCIFENYFFEKSNFTTIFSDKSFEKAVEERANFIKMLADFNLKNFGDAFGRGGLSPLVKGDKYNFHGTKSIETKLKKYN